MPAGVAAVQGDDAPGDAKLLAAKAVVMLGVKAGIGQHRAESRDACCLAYDGRQVG
jgi:hypothetical protein